MEQFSTLLLLKFYQTQSKEEAGKVQNILLFLLELQLLLSFKSLIRTVMTIMNIIFIMSKRQKLFGYIDVGDGCRRRKVLVTILRCW